MNINTYFDRTKRLVSSMVIKIDDIYKHHKVHIDDLTGRETSKYYLNLTGQRWKYDPVVMVMMNGVDYELTTDTLDLFPSIRVDLIERGVIYQTLMREYPYMATYIQSIAYRLTMDEVLDAKDGTILAYNDELIIDNEIGVIDELNVFINNYLMRYHNNRYILDDMYIASMLNGMYVHLVIYLLSIRVKHILSTEVDEFHLYNYLMGYKHLYPDTAAFDQPTRIWIYGNLRRMKHTIGNNTVLSSVMNDVLARNNYGMGKLNVLNDLPTLTDDKENYYREYYESSHKIVTMPANVAAYDVLGKTYSLGYLESLGRSNGYINEIKSVDNEKYYNDLNKLQHDNALTKIFVLDQPEALLIGERGIVVALDNLLWGCHTGAYSFIVDYKNKIDSRIYKLNAEDVKYLILKGLKEVYNTLGAKVECGVIYTNNRNRALSYTWGKSDMSKAYDFLTSNNMLDINVVNISTVRSHIAAVLELEVKLWYLISNSVDNIMASDVKSMGGSLFQDQHLSYTETEIETYINDNDLGNFYGVDNWMDTLLDLVSVICNVNVDEIDNIHSKYNTIQNYIKKNTSYAIQILKDLGVSDTVNTVHLKNSINLGYKSMAIILATAFDRYEMATYWPIYQRLDHSVIGIQPVSSPNLLCHTNMNVGLYVDPRALTTPIIIGHEKAYGTQAKSWDVKSKFYDNDVNIREIDKYEHLSGELMVGYMAGVTSDKKIEEPALVASNKAYALVKSQVNVNVEGDYIRSADEDKTSGGQNVNYEVGVTEANEIGEPTLVGSGDAHAEKE